MEPGWLRVRRFPLLGLAITSALLWAGRCSLLEAFPYPYCLFLKLTGYPCAFCGGTRAFSTAAQGRIFEALHQSPLGTLAWIGVWALLGWSVYRLARPAAPVPGQAQKRPVRLLVAGALVIAIASWFYRLAMGFK